MSEVVCINSDLEGSLEFEKDSMEAKRRLLLDTNGKVMLVFNTVFNTVLACLLRYSIPSYED